MNNNMVYIYTNKINNKVYVGQTHLSLARRAGGRGHGYKGCILFYNAILKYGWDNFEPTIVEANLTEEEANDLEKKLIAQYESNNPDKGYNLTQGGKDGRTRGNVVLQYDFEGNLINTYPSQLEAETQTGINYSHIGKCCNVNNPFYKTAGGYIWRYEDNPLVLGEAQQIIEERYQAYGSHAVVQVDLKSGEIINRFPSIAEAARQTNITEKTASRDLDKIKVTKGFTRTWILQRESDIEKSPFLKKIFMV